ncbi:MAG TPA: NAD(P)H-dependent oxidoreductase [Acidimicrobiales bacterium]|jgi:NAD(P)H-dependent FMN reductase|nr:NAD(P)H-dependent oxidoreductase [Acidimicrobiales bacterium]
MSKLQIIVGSTRETRAADRVLPWVTRRAEAHPDFDVEVLDLRDWPLPMFAEHLGTIGDRNDPTYSDPIVKRWNQKIKEGDAFLVITPEYNHSVPGVLKNAIDNVFVSFALRNKPIAAVGYSGGLAAAIRAIEHLAHIAIEADMHPLRSSVLIPFVQTAFDDDGSPKDPMTETAMQIVLDDLAWWSKLLESGRAAGELPPAVFRLRAGSPKT